MLLVLSIIASVIEIYSFALIIYILMSWFPNARETAIGRFLATICEPYLAPFSKFVPSIGMLDLSPLVALIVLNLAGSGLAQLGHWIV
ncbi:YggT family protein [Peribacillus psychrosaccharolyticus]|uniref:YggT family protein n=1 Tax=Peribacillus psychrosaccharolyticus TaxID=1407 RepID=A0A974S1F7_PERPY|nr:YggT family protein [Peribacillus psychrosaccharolyticus]MEC2053710.1 YggT family protein [Peribacillus psychrosaccharolyticus]MED3742675.1 YggT family protein [Peribacillus psychrosaccharolyticus]QQT01617.1 YggT family protein [Peribacillus psychrosaccharolyticus]